ncbi:MAG: ABC transporter permease [Candidatus Omnitrophota bacterium]
MLERVKYVIIKEFTQVLRDPKMKVVIFVIPLVQLMIFGLAVSTDVREVKTAVYDLDNTPESRELIRAFTYSGYFAAKEYIYSGAEEKALIDRSLVQAVIHVNRGFARDMAGGNTADFQLIIDGTDSNTAAVIASYAGKIAEEFSSGLLAERMPAAALKEEGAAVPRVDLCMRAWYNENLISRNFFVPGIIALILLILTMLLTAMAIVKEKESGTIEQLMVSPIKPVELILGKLIPFGVIGLIDVMLIILLSVALFRIPVRGNIFFLTGCALLYLLTTLGMGLFISTRSKTQQEALMSTFFIALPVVLLSGFIFSIDSMPVIVQWLTFLNPLRYFLDIVRGVFLKGIGIKILWPQMTALLLIGIFVFTISSVSFRRKIG